MISKELLSEVLGVDYKDRLVDWFQIEDDGYLRTYYNCGNYDNKGRPTGLGFEINIYELAHQCKEWAMQTPYIVDQLAINIDRTCLPNKFKTRYWCVWILRYRKVSEEFYADTEPEAIFKACQWILENKENK